MAKQLQDTKYPVGKDILKETWRSGLGEAFDTINKAIDTLQVVPVGWESSSLFKLSKSTDQYLLTHPQQKKIRPQILNTPRKGKTRPQSNKNGRFVKNGKRKTYIY